MDTSAAHDRQVAHMLASIERDYDYAGRFTGLPAPRPQVLAALAEVPREEFVPCHLRHLAYENRALPIEDGQTISQPFIVALMTDLLEPETGEVMLEIGTGSGYQAAVLSRLVSRIYSVEIIPALAEKAAMRLKRLGFGNIQVKQGDGYSGWPEYAPYDGIIVTAAAPSVPPPLLVQLKPGGRLVLPLRRSDFGQELVVIEKGENGRIRTREVLSVAFVPLTGSHGNDP